MLLYGNLKSNKTEILIENYARLLNEGVNSDEILVIVQNSKLKDEFIESTREKLKIKSLFKFNIYSFFGLCYNFILDYYPIIENKITKGDPCIIPNLCGLEASGYIFKNLIEKINFKGYNSKKNLLHQLLRRQSLITLNSLSNEDVKNKTKILKESFSIEINNTINLYKHKTLEYRAFDYLRQVQLFSYIYKNVKNPYKYVFIDDADEICPALFEYLKFIKPSVKEFFIAYDKFGSSRKGYLCASENNFELFLNEAPTILNNEDNSIYENIINDIPIEILNLNSKAFIKADEMAKNVVLDVNNLINNGVKKEDILIIIPDDDKFLKFYLNEIDAPVNFISGSEKLEENKTVAALISALKLLIEGENFKLSSYKLKGFLGRILNLELNTVIKICAEYESDFNQNSFFEILKNYSNEKTDKFLELKNLVPDKLLSELLYDLAEFSIEKIEDNKKDIQKINQLLKQIRDFENIFKDRYIKKELLHQLENTIIAENPLEDNKLEINSITVSTPQKAIDFKIKNKYLFLLDTTNSNWIKQDIGPLYNAWVFQKNWIKSNFSLEDNIFCSKDKIARVLRKLLLLNNGKIFEYSTVYNFLGVENFKGIKHFFKKENTQKEAAFKIIPREDQKPVLDYKEGKFATMAVAGAGKTTIMLALIMKFLDNKVAPENIFVLTYMDSACRTFRERIKKAYPNLAELPNISTIHGLAMRILRENNNHAHIGLDVDFDIIDEIQRLKLIGEIIYNEGLETSKINVYERAISAFKNSNNKNENLLSPVFKRIYSEYQKSLKSFNLIDYDDLLIYALELLKFNSKIREYYQELAHFVIEDEAQDSSAIQQELINIISKKYGNLIRTGDINQAITGTFTNSDTTGFKNFIKNNPNCKMNYTARNSTGVIDLANKLIKKGLKISPSAFFEIETKPVLNKNMIDPNACVLQTFNNECEEKDFILNEIKNIFEYEKSASIGILTRTNREAENFAQYLKNTTPYKITINTGLLSSNPIFLTVLGVFNFISNPMNNKNILDFTKTMMDFGFYTQDISIFDKLSENSPFILGENEDFSIFWDLRYFLELVILPVDEFAYKIGEFYFKNNKKHSINIAPVASIVSKIFQSEKNFEDTLNKMNEIKIKQSGNFKILEEKDNAVISNEIKIMTLHKSKGDEFDYVFIPFLTDRNMGLNKDKIKLKDNVKIMQSVQNFKKTEELLKQETVDENFRLLYVGITRAKKKLYLTCAHEYKFFNKKTNVEISDCFGILKGE